MKFQEVRKGDYILNIEVPGATSWWVAGKCDNMVLVRRKPKTGKLIAVTQSQLKDFQSTRKTNMSKQENKKGDT